MMFLDRFGVLIYIKTQKKCPVNRPGRPGNQIGKSAKYIFPIRCIQAVIYRAFCWIFYDFWK